MKTKQSLVYFTLTAVLLQGGCAIISLLGTPTNYEKKIPAEYDLGELEDKTILVLVEQPGWLNAGANLRFYLTDATYKNITNRIKFPPENLIDYTRLSKWRSTQSNFSRLTPAEVGKALGADLVLFMTINSFELNKMVEADFFKGQMNTQAALFDTSSGDKVWPKSEKAKVIKVGFDIESSGRETAIKRLASSCAYCTTRYLYNCPKEEFKIFDDRSAIRWQKWE